MHKGQVPLALVKCVAFLETLTNYYSLGYQIIYIYRILKKEFSELLSRASETVIFVLKETDLCSITTLIYCALLEDGASTKYILPQTVLSLTMISIKFLNNVGRLNLQLLQEVLQSPHNRDQIYHIFSFLITYCSENYSLSEDVKDLLSEVHIYN